MRVLLVSKFLHHVGGVETYLRWLANELDAAGHDVGLVGMQPPDGERVMDMPGEIWPTPTRSYSGGAAGRARSAATSVWSPAAGRVMERALTDFRPDIVHFHGTCYQLTPAVVHIVAKTGTPNVLTAHEYKLVCANQTLFDDSQHTVCTDCLAASRTTQFVSPIARACMKGSRAVSLLGAAENQLSQPTWRRANPLVLAPSPFMRELLIAHGWPADRVRYLDLAWRPENQIPPTVPHAGNDNVVFLGRLAIEKGVELILRVWAEIAPRHPSSRLRVLGDGERLSQARATVARERIPRVDFLGRVDMPRIQEELSQAALTVHPAQWHENSPYAVRESLMAGVPAVVSDLGGMPAMIPAGAGCVVAQRDVGGWVRAVDELLSHPIAASPALIGQVTTRATTSESHMQQLMAYYAGEVAS